MKKTALKPITIRLPQSADPELRNALAQLEADLRENNNTLDKQLLQLIERLDRIEEMLL